MVTHVQAGSKRADDALASGAIAVPGGSRIVVLHDTAENTRAGDAVATWRERTAGLRSTARTETRRRLMSTVYEETVDHLDGSPRSVLVSDAAFDEGIITADLSPKGCGDPSCAECCTGRCLSCKGCQTIMGRLVDPQGLIPQPCSGCSAGQFPRSKRPACTCLHKPGAAPQQIGTSPAASPA